MPIAFARSAGSVKSVIISESATADTTAPPRPCTARPATRSAWEVASPQPSEARREERDPDEEETAVPEEIAEPAAEQEKAAEREQIGVDDPRQRRLREAEILADRGQRDAHDRHVEDDHQVAEAEDEEREPASAAIGGHVASSRVAFRGVRPRGRAELIGPAPMSFAAGRVTFAMAARAPQTIGFAIRGPIARADLPGLSERVCALLSERGLGRARRRERRRHRTR